MQNNYPGTTVGALGGEISPPDRGFTAWIGDPLIATSTGIPVLGVLNLSLFKWPGGFINNLFMGLSGDGIGLTAGQNFLGVYNAATTALVASSADATAPFGGPTNALMTVPMAVPAFAPPGYYYAAMLANAGTIGPSVQRINTSVIQNLLGVAPLNYSRGGTSLAGLTALPANLGAVANGGVSPLWYGVN